MAKVVLKDAGKIYPGGVVAAAEVNLEIADGEFEVAIEFLMMAEETNLHFEAALDELEKLVARMEDGDLPLEDTLKQFERGIELARHCQKALSDAEQKVEILVEKSGRTEIEPFETEK